MLSPALLMTAAEVPDSTGIPTLYGIVWLALVGCIGVLWWVFRQWVGALEAKHDALASEASKKHDGLADSLERHAKDVVQRFKDADKDLNAHTEELRRRHHDIAGEVQKNVLAIQRLEATSADKDSLHALEMGIRNTITTSFAELEDRLGKRIDAAVKGRR